MLSEELTAGLCFAGGITETASLPLSGSFSKINIEDNLGKCRIAKLQEMDNLRHDAERQDRRLVDAL